MMETNRQRLERLGMMDDDTIDSLTEGIRCDYCFWFKEHGGGVCAAPNGPIMCEGRWCDDAIKLWLEDDALEDEL